jgi:hypothetical protein
LCPINKFKKSFAGLKAFCSRRRPFWGRLLSGAKSKELDPLAAGLGTQTAFDFHPPSADLTPRYRRRLNPKMLNGARKKLSKLLGSLQHRDYIMQSNTVSPHVR